MGRRWLRTWRQGANQPCLQRPLLNRSLPCKGGDPTVLGVKKATSFLPRLISVREGAEGVAGRLSLWEGALPTSSSLPPLPALHSPPFHSAEPQKIYSKIMDGVFSFPIFVSEAACSIVAKLCRWVSPLGPNPH